LIGCGCNPKLEESPKSILSKAPSQDLLSLIYFQVSNRMLAMICLKEEIFYHSIPSQVANDRFTCHQ